jgi:hypothetical protein
MKSDNATIIVEFYGESKYVAYVQEELSIYTFFSGSGSSIK